MKIIRYSSRYKKDIKLYANQPDKIKALFDILKLLGEGKPIPAENNPHPLPPQLTLRLTAKACKNPPLR